MNCEDYQLLIVPHILGRQGGLHVLEIVRLEAHLLTCESCAREYAESARVIQAIRDLPPEMLAQALSGPAGDQNEANLAEEPIEANGDSLGLDSAATPCSDKGLETRHRARTWRFRVLTPAALAACLMLVFTAWLFHRGSARPNEAMHVARQNEPNGVARAVMGTLQAVDERGPDSVRPVAAGQVLTASRQERLRIWDRHEVTLEPGTKLEVDGSQADGCRLKLSEGRVLASVHRVSGEGVFEVITPQAKLRIMGTVFSVTAKPGRTQLGVSEGVVQLASLAGTTQPVAAGQTYETDGRAVVKADTKELPDVLAVATAISEDPVKALRNSRWYKQRFAPLLALNDYLKAQKVDSDELTILAISADLWCIQYPKDPKADLPPYIQRKAGLERAAQFYGYEVKWLTPADAGEAARLTKEALSAGQLVLGYGLAGEEDVQVRSAERLQAVFSEKSNGYRFLGETKVAAWSLAIVVAVPGSKPERDRLPHEAAEDVRRLLEGIEDTEYRVGQPAVEAWGAAFVAKDEEMRPMDPIVQSLNAIGGLGTDCQEQYSALGEPGDKERWLASCRQIEKAIETAGGAGIHGAAEACEKDRRSQREDSVTRIRDALRRLTAVGFP